MKEGTRIRNVQEEGAWIKEQGLGKVVHIQVLDKLNSNFGELNLL